ncbi:FAD-binding oxidoreductase [Aeromicrobium panaciterrae]
MRLAKKTSNLFRPRDESVTGLDVSGLDGVIDIDIDALTADVQGMCTYEDLVAETLPRGLMPYVVPQLKTITLGGAVTGLGIESTSFRSGLPHESVLEMDILTGSGEIVTAAPEGDHADLFDAFPNSYGSLGYATRLRIKLEVVPARASLRHVRVADANAAVKTIEVIADTGEWEGVRVDALDGTAFSPDEIYLTLAQFTNDAPGKPSDYTGQQIYYKSIQTRETDSMTMEQYIWRWDTDWFWCSGAFGAQNKILRRIWPRRWRRSDVYHRLVGLDEKVGLSRLLDRIKKVPGRERVIQDIEVPVDRLPEFLEWFDAEIGMRPVWLCPLRTTRAWPVYPLTPGATYVNAGFWGTVEVPAGSEPGAVNRRIEEAVQRMGGHKSLYSEAFYDQDTFEQMYGGETLAAARRRYDPDGRLSTLYEKAVRNT